MRPVYLRTFGFWLCLLCSTANATAPDNPHNQILQATGMSSLLKIVPLEIYQSAEQHALRCGASQDKTAPPDNAELILSTTLRQSLASDTSIGEAHEIARWYRSSAGTRITEMEKQLAAEAEIKSFIVNRTNSPEWMTERYPLFKRIYENTGAGLVNATIGVEIEYAGQILSGCIEQYKLEHPTATVNPEEVMAGVIRSDKELMVALFKQDSLFTMAFTLRALTTAELTAYAEFSELHKDYYQSLVQSFELALKSFSDTLQQQSVATTEQ